MMSPVQFPALRALCLSSLVLSLSTGGVLAQPAETVTVNDDTLSGLWKIGVPDGFGINLAQHARFEPMRNIFCRIEQSGHAFEIHCLNGGYAKSGSGTVDGNQIHIAWGSMMARMVIDGTRANSAIDGHFTFKFSGIAHGDAAPSHSERLSPPTASTDAAGKSGLLKAVLEGQPVPRDIAAIAKNEGALPDTAKLGSIQVMAYLGQSPRLGGQSGLDYFSVYAVEFDSGERICGLHQRADGVLDAFLCV